MKKITLKNVNVFAAKHEAFNCNNTLRGDWTKRKPMTGKMNDSEQIKILDSFFHGGDDTFVIKSYETPIAAWNKTNGWWISGVGYTNTTKRHLRALNLG